jgi:hypothetical protein
MKTVGGIKFERSGAKYALAALVGVVAVGVWRDQAEAQSNPAECVSAGMNCSFTISEKSIQKAPTLFKLQAQISQAKIPLGDAKFSSLSVKVKSGNTELCTERFTGVNVRGGVLNLEIGRNLEGCQLDDTIAAYNDLAFQVCIGDSSSEAGNCLKPIQMSSVPYAVKASFASQAQEAHRAEIAARAHYTQRITADSATLGQPKIGVGFYDFLTPTGTAPVAALRAVNPTAQADLRGGFLQWAPMDATNKILNVSARQPNQAMGAQPVLEPLTKLIVHAADSNFWGRMSVLNTSTFSGRATFSAGIAANGTTSSFAGGINVSGGTVNVQVPTTIGNGSSSIAVSYANGTTTTFQAGSTVDMRSANVQLPDSLRTPAISQSETTAGNASACSTVNAPAGKVFCGLSSSQQVAISNSSCVVGVTGSQWTLTACRAQCAMRCF